MFEHAYGRAPEQVEPVVEIPEDALAIHAMSWREMQVLAVRFSEDLAKVDSAFVTIDGAVDTEAPRTVD